MRSHFTPIIALALFLITPSVFTQQPETFRFAPNGSLILDPPPDQTGGAALLAFSNPTYLSFIYSSTDGISNGISTGLTPILDSVIEIGNSSCVADDPNAFFETWSTNSTVYITWLVGIIVLAVFGVVMCILVACTCCIVCCCRVLCANCGAERTQNLTPSCTLVNLCIWSPILLVFLFMCILGCLFGILSYVSFNTYVESAPTIYDNSLDFINDTLSGLSNQLEFTIQTQLNATFEATIMQVQALFDNSFGDRLDGLVTELNSSVDVIDALKVSANALQADLTSASSLITNFNNAASALTTKLGDLQTQCGSAGIDCSSIPSSVTTGLSASNVPDISAEVMELNQLDTSDLTNVVANVTSRIDSEVSTLRGTFDDLDILASFDIGNTFTTLASTIGQSLTSFRFNNLLTSLNIPPASFLTTYSVVSKIVLAVVIIVFVSIIINVLFAVVGLVIAIFGYDSEAKPSMRSTLSNTGAILLTLSSYVGLFMTCIMIPILVVIFSLGSVLTTVSQPLVDQSILTYLAPCLSSFSQDIQAGNFGTFTLQVNITHIFTACQNGDTLLDALQAGDLANQIINNVSGLLNDEVQNIRGQINPNVISDGIIDSYMASINMYDTGDFNFDAANSLTADLDTTQVVQNINNARGPLMNLISTINSGPSSSTSNAVRASAEEILLDLDNLETNLIPQANTIIASTQGNLNALTTGLTEVNVTLTMAFATVTEFASNLTGLTNGLIDNSISTLEGNALTYLIYVRDNIPKCRFLPEFYTAVVDVICLGVLRNFNALWFCLGWALIFLLLSGIFSFIVARYTVRREHESWFEEEDENTRDNSVPKGQAEPTAPNVHGYLDSNVDQPPPFYTYQNQNIEMHQQPSYNTTDTPVLTQLRAGEKATW